MTINSKKDGNTLVVGVSGRLDSITAPELETFLMNNVSDISELILDLKDLDYTSSAGLRVFLKIHKMMLSQGKLIIENVKPDVMEVLEITGFSDFLTIR